MVRDDGRVVLTDFGIATSTGDSSLTSTGLLLGSPAYIAPERARGQAARAGVRPVVARARRCSPRSRAGRRSPATSRSSPSRPSSPASTSRSSPPAPSSPCSRGLLEKDPALRLDAGRARELLRRSPRAARRRRARSRSRSRCAPDARTSALDLGRRPRRARRARRPPAQPRTGAPPSDADPDGRAAPPTARLARAGRRRGGAAAPRRRGLGAEPGRDPGTAEAATPPSPSPASRAPPHPTPAAVPSRADGEADRGADAGADATRRRRAAEQEPVEERRGGPPPTRARPAGR
jgi:hypothetical protein